MGTEIERKFRVRYDTWREQADAGTRFRQGYLVGSAKVSVRVRIEGQKANLNIKSATLRVTRSEYEYAIPRGEAEEMLDQLCEKPLIEKTRYRLTFAGVLWEVDVFAGDNEGLVVAEVELPSEDATFEVPPWAGEEVSHDKRYYNVCLVKHPYKDWTDRDQ
ncbi:CYTH domain-containing protein [Thiohalomonas denitrificans]|uniref:CYTH domain-containing protein n=1 Tax=Thiohalomonas denitrificans TaxID=415747 RepID=UPI0026EDA3A4|nr:CYTH domain-containing protein [Thiohalomonas denitrificans]